MRRELAVIITLASVALAWGFIAMRADGFVPAFADRVARVLAVPPPPPTGGMNFVECWCEPAGSQKGFQLGLLGILVAAFPAAIVAISLTTTPAFRGRSWSGAWRLVFQAGVVLQGGTVGLSLMMLAIAALDTLTFGVDALLMGLSLLGPSLFMSVAALPSWLRLQTAVEPLELPSLRRVAIQ